MEGAVSIGKGAVAEGGRRVRKQKVFIFAGVWGREVMAGLMAGGPKRRGGKAGRRTAPKLWVSLVKSIQIAHDTKTIVVSSGWRSLVLQRLPRTSQGGLTPSKCLRPGQRG